MKRIYLLLSTALLLCCFLNFNLAQAQTVPVTFKVDMTGQNVSNGVYVTGDFTKTATNNNWSLLAMADEDGDMIYSLTSDVAVGSEGAYVFRNANNWDDASRETVPTDCAPLWGTHRGYNIPAAQTEAMEYAFVWSSCEAIQSVSECSGVVAYHQVDATGGWNGGVTDITINAGQSIKFGPQPNAGFTWTWTGPNGFTSSLRDPLVENFTTEMAGNYVATVRGTDCMSTITYAVTVNAPADPADATLSAVTVNGQPIASFDPATMSYDVTVASSPVTIVATPSNPNATVVQDPAGEVAVIAASPTAVTLTVSPADGTSPAKVYTINISLCEPTAITHNYQIDNGDWVAGNTVSADPGQTVVLGPQPGEDNGWTWSGPNGFTANTREITLADIDADNVGDYVAIFTNTCGTQSTATFTLNVTAQPNGKTIVFVAKPLVAGEPATKDDAQINWLRANGFTVNTYYNKDLTTTITADIQMLNDADLVIIGRSGSSGDFPKDVWNTITTPIILNHQWASKIDRMAWFDFNGPTNNNEAGQTIVADILEADDVVFHEVTLGENATLPWSVSPDDFIKLPTLPTNGTVLAQVNSESTVGAGTYLFVRFDANQPFYEGGGIPIGERTYFGFGNDASGTVNFFPLTAEAKSVYLNEIMRLSGISIGPLSQATTPAPADDATGQDPAETTVSWEGNGVTYSLYLGTTAGELTLVEEGITTPTYVLADLDPATEYFWRVDSHNGDRTEAGMEWSFTTATGSGALAKVSNMAPAKNAMVEKEGLTLSWEGNGDTYDVFMGTEANKLSRVAENLTATNYQPANLELNKLYYWRVDAKRGEAIEAGEVFNFTPIEATGFDKLASQGISIYPNPVGKGETLNLNNAAELVSVNIYNAQGVLVKSISSANNAVISINVSELNNGIYLLKAVKKDRSVLSGKFLKK